MSTAKCIYAYIANPNNTSTREFRRQIQITIHSELGCESCVFLTTIDEAVISA